MTAMTQLSVQAGKTMCDVKPAHSVPKQAFNGLFRRTEHDRKSLRHAMATLVLVITTGWQSANATCWEQAAQRYRVSSGLLYAIAKTESNFDPHALSENRNGSYDIGLMQINSSWLAEIQKFGIEPADLYDGCTNLHVGAWILAQEIRRYGYSWDAVGAYHAGAYTARNRKAKLERYRNYAQRVYKNYRRLFGE